MTTPIQAVKGTDGVLTYRVAPSYHPGGMAPSHRPNCHHLKCAATVAAAGLSITALALAVRSFLLPRLFPYLNNRRRPLFKEERLLRHVFARAQDNNPESVLAVIDSFCRETQSNWMMNVGDVKGVLVKQQVQNRRPQIAVELGAYCGYSAVLIGSHLPSDGHLYSIELDPLHAAIATKIVEFAGLKDKVTILVGTLEERLPTLQHKYKIKQIDLLFLDHAKSEYKPDLIILEQAGLLKAGAVVVADNVIFPGNPEYLAYIRDNPHYHSVFHESQLEYLDNVKDGVEISVRK